MKVTKFIFGHTWIFTIDHRYKNGVTLVTFTSYASMQDCYLCRAICNFFFDFVEKYYYIYKYIYVNICKKYFYYIFLYIYIYVTTTYIYI
jgi:hypothetical protein